MHQDQFPVAVITISYNSAHCISNALQSVLGARERIVVDNASADGSADVVAPYATLVIPSAQNRGFGVACNAGAAQATQDLLLFLNPDAVMRPGALERLVQCARDHPQAVAFGGRVALPDARELAADYQSQLARAEKRSVSFPNSVGSLALGQVPSIREVDNITGAALLCRTAVFREIGGFDEGFFLYFEDEDLCRRLRRHGPLLIDDAAIYAHLPGTGVKLDARRRFDKYRHYGHSRVRFSSKYDGGFRRVPAAIGQGVKGALTLLRGDVETAAQHFGRAVGYLEGSG